MKATLQPVADDVFVLRIHPADDAELGAPYVAAGTVVRQGYTAFIQGFCGAQYTVAVWRAVRDALDLEGFIWARWTRGYGADARDILRAV